jgi:aryl carrier-like protein
MASLSVHILIISSIFLLTALGLAYANSVAPLLGRSAQKELEKDEYLRSEKYIRDVEKLDSIRDMELNQKLRHQKIRG